MFRDHIWVISVFGRFSSFVLANQIYPPLCLMCGTLAYRHCAAFHIRIPITWRRQRPIRRLSKYEHQVFLCTSSLILLTLPFISESLPISITHNDDIWINLSRFTRASSGALLCPCQKRSAVECTLIIPTFLKTTFRVEVNPAIEINSVHLHPYSICLEQIRWFRTQRIIRGYQRTEPIRHHVKHGLFEPETPKKSNAVLE